MSWFYYEFQNYHEPQRSLGTKILTPYEKLEDFGRLKSILLDFNRHAYDYISRGYRNSKGGSDPDIQVYRDRYGYPALKTINSEYVEGYPLRYIRGLSDAIIDVWSKEEVSSFGGWSGWSNRRSADYKWRQGMENHLRQLWRYKIPAENRELVYTYDDVPITKASVKKAEEWVEEQQERWNFPKRKKEGRLPFQPTDFGSEPDYISPDHDYLRKTNPKIMGNTLAVGLGSVTIGFDDTRGWAEPVKGSKKEQKPNEDTIISHRPDDYVPRTFNLVEWVKANKERLSDRKIEGIIRDHETLTPHQIKEIRKFKKK